MFQSSMTKIATSKVSAIILARELGMLEHSCQLLVSQMYISPSIMGTGLPAYSDTGTKCHGCWRDTGIFAMRPRAAWHFNIIPWEIRFPN